MIDTINRRSKTEVSLCSFSQEWEKEKKRQARRKSLWEENFLWLEIVWSASDIEKWRDAEDSKIYVDDLLKATIRTISGGTLIELIW